MVKMSQSSWLFIVCTSFGLFSCHALGDDRQSLLQGYAATIATATFAEQNCPSVTIDVGRLLNVRIEIDVADSEKEYVMSKAREVSAAIKRTYPEHASEWCSSAINMFGKDGFVAPGILVSD